jgi:hypothetical protein
MILFRRYVDVDLLHPLYTTGYRDRRRGYITAIAGFVGPLVGRCRRVEVGLDGVGSWGGSGGLRGRRIIGGERKNQAEYEQERADRKRERESRS